VNGLQKLIRKRRIQFRRKLRKQKRQVEDITTLADDSINRLVFRRVESLYKVRRFVTAWIVLTFFIGFGSVWQVRGLDQFYLKLAPTDGGIYREGVLGSFTNASPLFAVTNVDVAVSRLVFSGLFAAAPDGSLQADIASELQIDDKGLNYTVKLKDNVRWHDGEQLNADDVVFTYNIIQHPNVGSPLSTSWQGVEVQKVDDYTVVFKLPNPLSSFKYSMTNGIVPEHILGKVDPGDFRTSTFNTVSPVGSGPFAYTKVEVIGNDLDTRQEKITLAAHKNYHRSKVRIDGMVLRTYRDERSMVRDYERQQITSMVGLHMLPDDVVVDDSVVQYSTPLRSAVMLFFNIGSPTLTDPKIREALALATDTDLLRSSVPYQLAAVDGPFLKSHFSYDASKTQQQYNLAGAQAKLDELGWKSDLDGYRYKDGKRLSVRVVSQSLAEYAAVVATLQQQWKQAGVYVDASLRQEEDVQSSVIAGHEYEVLLYGIALGSDPDVFAFWHSSQADARLRTRLNLSEYSNTEVDESLEAGRTRLDEKLRTVKYATFLDRWRADVPAIALYQPRFLFISRGGIEGFAQGQFNGPADRFYDVANWQIRLEKTVR
jgi:peptide/nickel transport system substrate-binding protein